MIGKSLKDSAYFFVKNRTAYVTCEFIETNTLTCPFLLKTL